MKPNGFIAALKPNGFICLLTPIGLIARLTPIGFTTTMPIQSTRQIAAAVRGRRRDLGLNQAELAKRAGVSRKWVYEFESGKPTAELALVLRVLQALGFELDLRTEGQEERDEVDLDLLLEGLRRRPPEQSS